MFNAKKINVILLIISALFTLTPARAADYGGALAGYIFLQVEARGEAWYVYPENDERYYLGRPADAFAVMKELSLGAKHDFIMNTEVFSDRLSGLILLDVESKGEAYYIYPLNKKKYYLGRPDDAFRIMRELGRGISNADLAKIPVAGAVVPVTSSETILLPVPFTAQAPYGDWSDQRFEDGCEEASALMAVKWARGEQNLSQQEASDTILAVSDYILEKYGEYRDVSGADSVAWIYKDYFNYQKVALKKGVSMDDMIGELKKGNLIVAPMNGRLLKNPYYTLPGPEYHVLVIRGYDPDTQEFITNDPGTKRGELYRYGTELFFAAMRDYPTGLHEPILSIEKDIIVIWK